MQDAEQLMASAGPVQLLRRVWALLMSPSVENATACALPFAVYVVLRLLAATQNFLWDGLRRFCLTRRTVARSNEQAPDFINVSGADFQPSNGTYEKQPLDFDGRSHASEAGTLHWRKSSSDIDMPEIDPVDTRICYSEEHGWHILWSDGTNGGKGKVMYTSPFLPRADKTLHPFAPPHGLWVPVDDSLGQTPFVQGVDGCYCCGTSADQAQRDCPVADAINPETGEPNWMMLPWKHVVSNHPEKSKEVLDNPSTFLRRRWGLSRPLFGVIALARIMLVHAPQIVVSAGLLWYVPPPAGNHLERAAWVNVVYHTIVYALSTVTVLIASIWKFCACQSCYFTVIFVLPPHYFFVGTGWINDLLVLSSSSYALFDPPERALIEAAWDAVSLWEAQPLLETLKSSAHTIFCPDRIFVTAAYTYALGDWESLANFVDPLMLAIGWLFAALFLKPAEVSFWVKTTLIVHTLGVLSMWGMTLHRSLKEGRRGIDDSTLFMTLCFFVILLGDTGVAYSHGQAPDAAAAAASSAARLGEVPQGHAAAGGAHAAPESAHGAELSLHKLVLVLGTLAIIAIKIFATVAGVSIVTSFGGNGMLCACAAPSRDDEEEISFNVDDRERWAAKQPEKQAAEAAAKKAEEEAAEAAAKKAEEEAAEAAARKVVEEALGSSPLRARAAAGWARAASVATAFLPSRR